MSINYGELVTVGNARLNVYTEGKGEVTIVILAGAGVTAPVLEYRSFYRQLSDTYRVAVVEKSGYGKSESTGTERTVENMVNESREALKAAGIQPPYVLAAHSYSGFEAIYWANTFSDEVKAVFSIDMGLPETALEMEKNLPKEKKAAMMEKNKKLYAKICKRGLLAKMCKKQTVNVSGLLTSNYLNEEEKQEYEEMFYQNLTNEEVFDETMRMTENAKKAMDTGKIKVPAYFYISDMKIPIKQGSWREFAIQYADSIGAKYTLTDKGHMMYGKIPEQMAADCKAFLQEVL